MTRLLFSSATYLRLACGVLSVATIYLAFKVFYLSLQVTFANEQIDVFITMKNRAYNSEISAEEASDYISWYYGPGSKLPEGSAVSSMVEQVRSDTLQELRRYQNGERQGDGGSFDPKGR